MFAVGNSDAPKLDEEEEDGEEEEEELRRCWMC
jgi:hypothetical protein